MLLNRDGVIVKAFYEVYSKEECFLLFGNNFKVWLLMNV